MMEQLQDIGNLALAVGGAHPLRQELPETGIHIHISAALGTLLTVAMPHGTEALADRYRGGPILVNAKKSPGRLCIVWLLKIMGTPAHAFEPFAGTSPLVFPFPPGWPPRKEGILEDDFIAPTSLRLAITDKAGRLVMLRRLRGKADLGRELRDLMSKFPDTKPPSPCEMAAAVDAVFEGKDRSKVFGTCQSRNIFT